MAYGSGNTILALDYNTFAQGGASVNHGVANINTVWGVGTGDKGYGQSTTLPVVAGGTDTVTATQWSTMIARLNSILTHQSGSGSGITAPTAGATIAYLSTLSSSITTGFNNRLNATTNATDVIGTAPAAYVWNTSTPTTAQIIRTATWANADQARYFFNAGGKLILTFSVTNTLGNSKGADWASLLGTKMLSLTVGGYTNTRNGTGGTATATNTAVGYWNAGTAGQTVITLTSASGTADYGSNSVSINVKTNGVQGSNGDVGTVMTFTINLNDAAADTNTAPTGIPVYSPAGTQPTQGNFNDALNLSITTNVTVRPPETSNLPTAISNPTIA
jgi:hypothetical protein